MSRCPVSRVLRHLKRFAGFPVPFITLWKEGKPDFRDADPRRWLDCVNLKLCAVCGRKLGESAWYVGGPLARENRLFLDPAMHEACARESMLVCPFLNGTRPHYRGVDMVGPSLLDTRGRPDTMFLFRGRADAAQLIRLNSDLVIFAGDLEVKATF